MPRYTSRTGKNIVLRFKGLKIIVPANDYYETTAENLADLFPAHVKKLLPDEIIEGVEPQIPKLNIQEISPPEPIPVKIITSLTNLSSLKPYPISIAQIKPPDQLPPQTITPITTPTISPLQQTITPITTPTISPLQSQNIQNINLNSPAKLSPSSIKEVTMKEEISERLTEIINNSMDGNEDPDVVAFLNYIGKIISQK